ncbi:MAG: hypothetical protein AABW75_03920 [Nanoarchaeota archaeon]
MIHILPFFKAVLAFSKKKEVYKFMGRFRLEEIKLNDVFRTPFPQILMELIDKVEVCYLILFFEFFYLPVILCIKCFIVSGTVSMKRYWDIINFFMMWGKKMARAYRRGSSF